MSQVKRQLVEEAISYIDSWLQLNFDNSHLPGLQVAIQHDDNLVYSKSFGFANIENQERLTNQHLFRIASQSKTFTATAIMQLKEAGKLSLDDPVSKHLVWFKSSKDRRLEKITTRQLLNHSAGLIRDGEKADFWKLKDNFYNTEQLKQYVQKAELIYEPDETFKYSNFGYSYLGLLVESVSGLDYEEYVEAKILAPLKLSSTRIDFEEELKDRLVTGYGYEFLRQPRKPFKQVKTHDMASATGFCSNAEDMCRYSAAHFIGNDALISDQSKRVMQHGYWEVDADTEKYGLGLVSYPVKKGWNLYGHSGGFPGFITNTKLDSKKKIAVSVMVNCIDSLASVLNTKLISILDVYLQGGQPTKSSNKKYAGRFYSPWGAIDIVPIGNKIYACIPMHWYGFDDVTALDELEVLSNNTLRIKAGNGFGSKGELVKYKFDGDKLKSLIYAGGTLIPWQTALDEGLI